MPPLPQVSLEEFPDPGGTALVFFASSYALFYLQLSQAAAPLRPPPQVALEEFPDLEAVLHDTVYVRIANIPLQESIRDLR